MEAVKVTLLYFEGCPNWRTTDERLHGALAATGNGDVVVERVPIRSDEQAQATRFSGSPTVFIDGRDPFAEADTPHGLSCRVYSGDAGLTGSPTVEQLIAALR